MIKSQVGVEFAAKNPVSIESVDAQDAYLNGKIHPPFDEAHVLHEIKHHLPAQSALKDFIHHNSLHAYQHLKFYEAIFKAAKIFGYQVTLQLEEFRQLYKNGRIREEVLNRVIEDKRSQTGSTMEGKIDFGPLRYLHYSPNQQLESTLEKPISP
nr:putative inorganic carbon transporter subunit DabA [Haliscomenobacter sp.]